MLEKERLIQEIDSVINWIREYVDNSGAKGVVVGNSGGKDSATVIALATKALGKERVLPVGMPCNSIPEDLEDARLVAEKFGLQMLELDLSSSYNEYERALTETLEKVNIELAHEAKINIKPRVRMTSLYAIAQSLGYLVIGTGNLCEAMVGYTTKWGDSASDFNPLGNFTVDEVLFIGEYLGVPEKIIHKAPNDGLGGLTDEEKLGVTYKQIAEYIETGKTDPEAMVIIEKKNKASKHKRGLVPIYKVDRTMYLS
jgi:NAD+ synthase